VLIKTGDESHIAATTQANSAMTFLHRNRALLAFVGLFLVGSLVQTPLYDVPRLTMEVPEHKSVRRKAQEKSIHDNTKRDADGCYHVFIDVGANIGVHGRFLLEPEKYPEATVAHSVFNNMFGKPETRDNRDFCVFEIEANPRQRKKIQPKADAYAKMGWRYEFMNVAGKITSPKQVDLHEQVTYNSFFFYLFNS